MPRLILPTVDRRLEPFDSGPPSPFPSRYEGNFPRVVYAAAHVVADPLALDDPWTRPAVDWEATLAFRRHLWGLGFAVAEAMDTSQRGMGLDWAGARELIARSLAEARSVPSAALACGAGTDQLDPAEARDLDDVIRAYEEQIEFIERHGGRVILMASRALAKVARGPEDYLAVYGRLLTGLSGKAILHWLGDMFDPALAGYWGSRDIDDAMAACLAVIGAHRDKIDGIKLSLLDKAQEERLRVMLPPGVKMYTGDDFNYAELIQGDGVHFSHGLLGIFDAIAPAAAAALDRLAAGDSEGYNAIFASTMPLSRRIFEAPTRYYKAGIVLLAWLNGFQNHFRMIGGMESARGMIHYADLFRLADQAGLLIDPDRAAARMRHLLALNGIA